jgi:hypothetical protein
MDFITTRSRLISKNPSSRKPKNRGSLSDSRGLNTYSYSLIYQFTNLPIYQLLLLPNQQPNPH